MDHHEQQCPPILSLRVQASLLERGDLVGLILPQEESGNENKNNLPEQREVQLVTAAAPPPNKQRNAEDQAASGSSTAEFLPLQVERIGRSHVFVRKSPNNKKPTKMSHQGNITQLSHEENEETEWRFVDSILSGQRLLFSSSTTPTRKPTGKKNPSPVTTDDDQARAISGTTDMDTRQRLQELGNKARTRLQEERSKRREIVQLSDAPFAKGDTSKLQQQNLLVPPSGRQSKATSSFAAAVRSDHQNTTKKKRKAANSLSRGTRSTTTTRSNRKKTKQLAASASSTQELQVPNIGHIAPPATSKDQSRIVELHGLPRSCTLERIKAFFTGFEPAPTVLVLLSNRVSIPCMDATYDDDLDVGGDCRADPTKLRVLVQFSSAPLAALAAGRSGETIIIPTVRSQNGTRQEQNYDENEEESKFDEESVALPISITLLSKEMATVLVGATVPVVLRGVPLSTILSNVQETLHPCVRTILWTAAARSSALEVPVDDEIQTSSVFSLLLPAALEDDMNDESRDPRTVSGYRTLAKQHNRLVDVLDELLHHDPYPSVDLVALEASRDPRIRLTTGAAKILQGEIESIDLCLHRARVEIRMRGKGDEL